jgi:hypothetical protein
VIAPAAATPLTYPLPPLTRKIGAAEQVWVNFVDLA